MSGALQDSPDDDERERTRKIVRRHAHDVRNHLNLLDLEAVMLAESNPQTEVAAALRRMRAQLVQLEAAVKALLFNFDGPRNDAM